MIECNTHGTRQKQSVYQLQREWDSCSLLESHSRSCHLFPCISINSTAVNLKRSKFAILKRLHNFHCAEQISNLEAKIWQPKIKFRISGLFPTPRMRKVLTSPTTTLERISIFKQLESIWENLRFYSIFMSRGFGKTSDLRLFRLQIQQESRKLTHNSSSDDKRYKIDRESDDDPKTWNNCWIMETHDFFFGNPPFPTRWEWYIVMVKVLTRENPLRQ